MDLFLGIVGENQSQVRGEDSSPSTVPSPLSWMYMFGQKVEEVVSRIAEGRPLPPVSCRHQQPLDMDY